MQSVRLIETDYCQSQKSIIRSTATSSNLLLKTITNLGEEFAKKIIEQYYLSKQVICTPMATSLN